MRSFGKSGLVQAVAVAIVLVFSLSLSSCDRDCAEKSSHADRPAAEKEQVSSHEIATSESAADTRPAVEAGSTRAVLDDQPLTVGQLSVTKRSFNPTRGVSCGLQFVLSCDALVTVTVCGPNHEIIAEVARAQAMSAGQHTILWDGLDREGGVVPDEAYFFCLQAVDDDEGVVVDPLTSSGGERIFATRIESHEEGRRLSYELPCACRVLARAGIVEGPLFNTIVNWEPRLAGFSVEHWDGRDASGVRFLKDVENARVNIKAFALPDLTTITTGNHDVGYREYYMTKAKDWPCKPEVAREPLPAGAVSPFAAHPPHLNRDPEILLNLVGLERPESSSQPVVIDKSQALVRVDIPNDAEADFMNSQRFELIIYVDDVRLQEIEQAHVPFTFPWDVTELEPGEHLLVINVASFRNHVGTASMLVDVKFEE